MVMKGYAAEPTIRNAPPVSAQAKLLIIDDEPGYARIIEFIAAQLGLESSAISDPRLLEKALEIADPTTIFLDIIMPGRDGLELIHTLAGRGYRGKIVLMSGADSPFIQMGSKIATALGLSIAGTLPKPFSHQIVQALLKDLLAAQARGAPSASNRRRECRQTITTPALIILNERDDALDCRLFDLSAGGACLDLAASQTVPHVFDLAITGGRLQRCGLRWMRGAMVGVQFLAK